MSTCTPIRLITEDSMRRLARRNPELKPIQDRIRTGISFLRTGRFLGGNQTVQVDVLLVLPRLERLFACVELAFTPFKFVFRHFACKGLGVFKGFLVQRIAVSGG